MSTRKLEKGGKFFPIVLECARAFVFYDVCVFFITITVTIVFERSVIAVMAFVIMDFG